ncbi:MAG TPA: DUF6452 family protein [Cyclobacteriaceae bacterium]
MRAFLFVGLCILMASCYDKGDCILTSSNLVRIDFYNSKSTASAKAIVFDSALVLPANYMFKDAKPVSVTTLLLPVDPAESQTAFVLYYSKKVDTLLVSYTTQAQVLSPNCGTFRYQNDLKIVYNTFPPDSAVVVNPKLRVSFLAPKDPVTNVKIYH